MDGVETYQKKIRVLQLLPCITMWSEVRGVGRVVAQMGGD